MFYSSTNQPPKSEKKVVRFAFLKTLLYDKNINFNFIRIELMILQLTRTVKLKLSQI